MMTNDQISPRFAALIATAATERPAAKVDGLAEAACAVEN
jgi:hypothetical protein